MKFILAADLHGGTNRYNEPVPGPLGSSRLEEFEQVLERLGTSAIESESSYVLIGGDLFEHRHPTPTMLRLVTTFLARMGAAGIVVLIVPGNHDGPHALGVEATHTLYWLKALELPNVRVYTRPTIEQWDDLTIVAMPYPHRRAFDVQGDGLPEERVIEAGRKMEALIRAYGRDARARVATPGPPLVFLGHMTVLGSRTASEQLMRMEWDIAVEPDAFEDFDFVALGHIHKMQGVGPRYDFVLHPVTKETQPNIWYPGSPVYLDFSEADQSKGFLLVDFVDPALITVIPIRSDPREMVRVRLEYIPEFAAAALTGLEAVGGTICELTITGTVRPPESWLEATENAFRRAGVFILKTKVSVIEPSAIAALVPEEAEDLTNKEVALRLYLHQHQYPDEPYVTLGREIIEAHR